MRYAKSFHTLRKTCLRGKGLTHRVHIVEANGESYRLRDSQRRM